jgi:hypothetical protein
MHKVGVGYVCLNDINATVSSNRSINAISLLVYFNPDGHPGLQLHASVFCESFAAVENIAGAFLWNVESILVCFVRWRIWSKSFVI